MVILDEQHYYPFGLEHGKYNREKKEFRKHAQDDLVVITEVANSGYQYKYQGQERQDDLNLNWDSFKWRNYDYAIGRFMSIDPLAQKFPYMTTYQFAGNKPVWSNEIEGLESNVDARMSAQYYNSLSDEGKAAHRRAEVGMLEAVVDEIPVVGEAKDIIKGDYGYAALSIIPFGKKLGQVVEKEFKFFKKSDGVTKKTVKTFDDVIKDAKPGRKTKGKTKQFEKEGGME